MRQAGPTPPTKTPQHARAKAIEAEKAIRARGAVFEHFARGQVWAVGGFRITNRRHPRPRRRRYLCLHLTAHRRNGIADGTLILLAVRWPRLGALDRACENEPDSAIFKLPPGTPSRSTAAVTASQSATASPFCPSNPHLTLPFVTIDHCNDCRLATGSLLPFWICTPVAYVSARLLQRSVNVGLRAVGGVGWGVGWGVR